KVDVRQLAGTGPGGRITKEDVQKHIEKQGSKEKQDRKSPAKPEATKSRDEAPPVPARGERRERMSAIRQRIAERLLTAPSNAATLTTFNEADMSAVMDLRGRYKEAFQKKHGVGLGFMSFFVKACVEAVHAFPVVNARIEGEDVVYPGHCHVGVAVSTEKG